MVIACGREVVEAEMVLRRGGSGGCVGTRPCWRCGKLWSPAMV